MKVADPYDRFGTNHVGHALLVQMLLPTLEATAKKYGDARVVFNTSLGYKGHPKSGIVFKDLRTPQPMLVGHWVRYGQSKLANLLYARSLAKHHPSITSVSLHPGVSATGLVTSMGFMDRALVYVTNPFSMLSPEKVAWNQVSELVVVDRVPKLLTMSQLWAATAPKGSGDRYVESGCYYEPVAVKTAPCGEGANDNLAEELWEWTEKELEQWRW